MPRYFVFDLINCFIATVAQWVDVAHGALVCLIFHILDTLEYENFNGDSDEERISLKKIIAASLEETEQKVLYHEKSKHLLLTTDHNACIEVHFP